MAKRNVTDNADSVCRNHDPDVSSFMTYHRVYSNSDTTDVTSGAGTAYPSGAPEFTISSGKQYPLY
jgi:hypothetical protein